MSGRGFLCLQLLLSRRRLAAWLLAALAVVGSAAAAEVTFLVTSDCHYDALENEDRNQRNRETVEQMNRISGVRWPQELGGDPIAAPRGVLVLGDLIDDGDRMLNGQNQGALQWKYFLADFGLDGTDGLLKYPVFEGWGNHDGPPPGLQRHGFSMQAELQRRNQLRKQKGLIRNVCPKGLHYSWDWDGIHFVQLNLFPADKPHPEVKYSPAYHDPQGALGFLRKDLETHVGRSGRPVVLMHHYDLQGSNWWHDQQRQQYREAIEPYNVVAIFHGHTATDVYRWKGLDVINTGQTENGFFVVQVTDKRMRLGYRYKLHKWEPGPDGKRQRHWDGTWGWRYLLDRRLPGSGESSQGAIDYPAAVGNT
jgi:cytolysin (calcineurin-like family phosphatase)